MLDDLIIQQGDNTELCKELAPGSIQCVVTSPPYYGLRDYGIAPTDYPEIEHSPMPGIAPIPTPAQLVCLGLESTPDAYIAHLVHLFRIIHPALADDGVMWVNIGDSYAASGKSGSQNLDKLGERLGTGGGHKASKSTSGRAPTPPGLAAKNLIGIPWRLAFALQADGWILRSDVIWHKPNTMPESVTDRCTKDHEYLFLLAKSERYYFNQDAIREPNITKSNLRVKANEKHANTGLSPIGKGQREWNNSLGRNKRTVWSIATKPLAAAHYAPMPEALAEPCILSSSRPGDLVLDPFGGTGTTARVAIANNRRAIIMDKNPAYIDIQDDRTAAIQRKLV